MFIHLPTCFCLKWKTHVKCHVVKKKKCFKSFGLRRVQHVQTCSCHSGWLRLALNLTSTAQAVLNPEWPISYISIQYRHYVHTNGYHSRDMYPPLSQKKKRRFQWSGPWCSMIFPGSNWAPCSRSLGSSTVVAVHWHDWLSFPRFQGATIVSQSCLSSLHSLEVWSVLVENGKDRSGLHVWSKSGVLVDANAVGALCLERLCLSVEILWHVAKVLSNVQGPCNTIYYL